MKKVLQLSLFRDEKTEAERSKIIYTKTVCGKAGIQNKGESICT